MSDFVDGCHFASSLVRVISNPISKHFSAKINEVAVKTLCLRCYVTGRVQGVGFRYATAEKAINLGVNGYVRNLPDRRVEVLACGEESAVIALRNWLWQGPQLARVSDVRYETLPSQNVHSFRID